MKIRTRIALWIGVAGLGATLVVSAVVFVEMRDQLHEIIAADLDHLVADFALVAEQCRNAEDFSRRAELDPQSRRNLLVLADTSGRIVWRSPLARLVDFDRPVRPGAFILATGLSASRVLSGADDEDRLAFQCRAAPVGIGPSQHLLVVGKPVENPHAETADLAAAVATGLAIALVVLVAGSFVVAGRILKPVAEIGRLAEEINENTLDRRMALPRSRDELYRLTHTLNTMFDRLQYSFTRQKQFAAAAAHELKTPLALLRLQCEELLQRRDLPGDVRQTLTRHHEALHRVSRLVIDLLDLSALELGDSLAGGTFALDRLPVQPGKGAAAAQPQVEPSVQ